MILRIGRRVRGADAERGVYSVLYAALAVVLIGIAAIVVDVAVVRENRRDNRAAADSAVLAGARFLSELSGLKPHQACLQAWVYLVANLENTLTQPPTACAEFAAFAAHEVNPADPNAVDPSQYCAATPPSMLRDEQSVAGITVIVAWPVPQENDEGFLRPNIGPGTADGDVEQDFNSASDGSPSGCDRIGVAVIENHELGLATGLGFVGGISTDVHSVARNFVSDENNDIAALNILDRTSCEALQTAPGKLVVSGAAGRPGIIAVESDARNVGSCGNNKWAIQQQNNANNLIHAQGPGGVGDGVIQSYAKNATAGNVNKDYEEDDVTSLRLRPDPVALPQRFGATPVTDIYACKAGVQNPDYPDTVPCTDPTDHLQNLRDALDGSVTEAPTPYAGAMAPYNTSSFNVLPNPTHPDPAVASFRCDTNADFSIPAGNWWVMCDTLDVGHLGVFRGGTVVFNGAVEVGSGTGCLVVNVPITLPGLCPSVALGTANTAPPSNEVDAIVYMRGLGGSDRLYKIGQGQVFLPRTVVIQSNDARVDMGGGDGKLFWTAPLAEDCALASGPASCRTARFQKIALWSDTTRNQALGGQTGLFLRGVIFTPRSAVSFDGQSDVAQNNAQFWAWRLLLNSNNARLNMAADPDNSIAKPQSSVSLIR